MDSICYALTNGGVAVCQELSSNQEEADTKLILHCANALQSNGSGCVILRSHFGDTDINIVAASLIVRDSSRGFIDFNTAEHRKVLCLGDLELSDLEWRALIGIHSFTGNDYASSFFRKSKRGCWNTIRSNPKYLNTFAELGNTWLPSDQLQKELEEFSVSM